MSGYNERYPPDRFPDHKLFGRAPRNKSANLLAKIRLTYLAPCLHSLPSRCNRTGARMLAHWLARAASTEWNLAVAAEGNR